MGMRVTASQRSLAPLSAAVMLKIKKNSLKFKNLEYLKIL
jgi:hypothetical protein